MTARDPMPQAHAEHVADTELPTDKCATCSHERICHGRRCNETRDNGRWNCGCFPFISATGEPMWDTQ